ncbi:hypothetical protein ES703_105090 [subsurface metagenome]
MKKSRTVVKLILLVIALAVMIGLFIILSWPIPPVHKGELIWIDHNTYEIYGQKFVWDDSYDPTEHWPYVREERSSSCFLAANPMFGEIWQYSEDFAKKFRARQKAAMSSPPSKPVRYLRDVRFDPMQIR